MNIKDSRPRRAEVIVCKGTEKLEGFLSDVKKDRSHPVLFITSLKSPPKHLLRKCLLSGGPKAILALAVRLFRGPTDTLFAALPLHRAPFCCRRRIRRGALPGRGWKLKRRRLSPLSAAHMFSVRLLCGRKPYEASRFRLFHKLQARHGK